MGISDNIDKCQCCGGPFVKLAINATVHTRCISKHFYQHAKGVNADQCKSQTGSSERTGA